MTPEEYKLLSSLDEPIKAIDSVKALPKPSTQTEDDDEPEMLFDVSPSQAGREDTVEQTTTSPARVEDKPEENNLDLF